MCTLMIDKEYIYCCSKLLKLLKYLYSFKIILILTFKECGKLMVIFVENSSLTLLLCAFLCCAYYLCNLFSKILFDQIAVNTEFIPCHPIHTYKEN